MKSLFDRQPNAFRLCFAAVALLLLTLAVKNVYQLLNVGSSDNYFQTTASRLYVTNNIRALRLVRVQDRYLTLHRRDLGLIRKGDLVTRINGLAVETSADAYEALVHLTRPVVEIEVQRPTKKGFFLLFEMSVNQLPENFLWEIPPTVYIWAVPPGGASDRAGLQPGDLIHQIDGNTFRDKSEADALVANMLRGETVTYGVIRRGEFLEIPVTMASLTIPVSLVVYQGVALAWLLFGLVLALMKADVKAARLLGMGFTVFGFWLVLSVYGGERVTAWGVPDDAVYASFFLAIGLLIHASFYFPRDRADLLVHPWHRYGVYPLATIAFGCGLLWGKSGFGVGFLLLTLPYLTLRIRYRSGRSIEHRKLDQPIVLGTLITVVIFAFWYFFEQRLPRNVSLLMRAGGAAFLLLCYLGTITRFRLLGLRMRRGFQYSLVTLGWTLLVSAVAILVLRWLADADLKIFNLNVTATNIEVLDQPISPQRRVEREKFFLMILAIGFGFLMFVLASKGYRFLQRKFYRAAYDDRGSSKALAELLTTQRHLDNLARGVVEQLARLMMIKRVGLVIFREEIEVCCVAASGFDAVNWRQFCDRAGRRIAETLQKFRCELRVEYLAPALKEHLLADAFRYLTPVYAGDQLVGCLMIGEKMSEATYRQQDFVFLEEKARQVGVAIENALLYERLSEQDRLRHELALARRIQLSSLPQTLPNVAGLDVAGLSRPAFEVGGDYYAYFDSQDSLTVIVGDVSGKGTSAALYMSKMQGVFSTLFADDDSLLELFLRANRVLAKEMEKKSFATAVCTRFEPRQRRLTVIRAGHAPLMIYRGQTGAVELCLPTGLALGIGMHGVFERILEERVVDYADGDVFLMFSDGLSEAFNPENESFGEDRLAKLLANYAPLTAREIRDRLMDDVAAFTRDAEQHDDQTLVVVKAEACPDEVASRIPRIEQT